MTHVVANNEHAHGTRTRPSKQPGTRPEQSAAEQRPQRYDEEISRFVERFAADLTEAGMQRMAARIFSCLLATDSGALSSAELGERLRISPAAISGAVRYLSHVRLVTREREPGSRREIYRVHPDVWYQTIHQRDAYFGRWINTFQEGQETLGPDTPAGRRLAESIEFFRFMERELAEMLDRWRTHRRNLYGPENDTDTAAGTEGDTDTAR